MLIVDDTLFTSSMLNLVLDLIGSNRSDAEQRIFEVRANLTRYLPMSSLHLTAQSSCNITVTGCDAIFAVLLGDDGRRSADAGPAEGGNVADQPGLAVGIVPAQLAVLSPVQWHTLSHHTIDDDANVSGAAELVRRADPWIAGIRFVARALLFFVEDFILKERLRPVGSTVAAVAHVGEHFWRKPIEQSTPCVHASTEQENRTDGHPEGGRFHADGDAEAAASK